MIDIKDISGNTRFSTPINEGSKRKYTLMKEDYVTLKFSVDNPMYFKLGDYVDESFGLFELVDLCKPTINESTGGYDYGLRLDAYYWKWKNKIFKFAPETGGQEASWNLTAPLDVHSDIILRNLQWLGYTYKGTKFEISIDSTVENKSLLMSYDNINILDSLFEMAKRWGCECWVTESVIHFGRCEFSDPVNFELGKNVEKMTRSDSQTNFATRVYAFGSTRNIPTNYRPVDESVVVNGVVQKRLMLPTGTPYIDAYPNMPIEEAVEDVVVFDDVYPRRIGTVSNITTHEYKDVIQEDGKPDVVKEWNAYRFKDSGITFSKDYILAGQELKIIFQSGALNGMEFAVTFNPCDKEGGETPISEKNEDGTWNPAAQVWEIVRNEDYGRPLPDETLIPKNGDTYVLSGFDTKFVSDAMIPSAEQELKDKAEKYIEKSKVDPSTYDCTMTFDSVKKDDGSLILFEVGDRVNLINSAYFETGNRVSRIIGFEYNLDLPYDSPVYTVGETASYSRIGDLESKVDSLTYKGQTYVGGGGSGVYLIRLNDSTRATDSNAFSAKRMLHELSKFLRKDQPDRTEHPLELGSTLKVEDLITALKGVLIGKNGSGITSLSDGTSQAVVDRLYVKIKAVFDELEVKKKIHVGGEQVISPAGMKCVKVEELPAVYRCYFKAEEEGIKIENQFTIGQLAMSQECNIKTGISHHVGNRFYWRTVTAVGADYIDLSKTEYDPNIENDIPVAGDDIVGFGHKTDITRQGAIVLSSVNEVAPSIIMYQGINDFTYAGKEVISLDFDKATGKARMKVYGDAYIGAKDGSSYVKYDKEGVDIKGKLHIQPGSTGWEDLEGLPESITEAAGLAIKEIEFGKNNLLRNSGFTGDYLSASLKGDTALDNTSELYSPSLKYWDATNAVAKDSSLSESGKEVVLNRGGMNQTLYYKTLSEENYIFSFRGKGTSLTFTCGGYTETVALTGTYTRYVLKFKTLSIGSIFSISAASGTLCELQLERGTVPSAWGASMMDNTSELAHYQSLQYISDAIKNGSVDVLGGLILAAQMQLGNYQDGKMQQVTSGMSGIYNDGDDVAFWSGGTFEQAINAVMKYKDNPSYVPTEEELKGMANYVATHGGRAILNDVIVRGYIYALGGAFSDVEAKNIRISGKSTFDGELHGATGTFKSLGCVNEQGDIVGGVSFGSDGKMWFIGDLYNQGYDYEKKRSYRFYTSEMWCRGSFGSWRRNTLVISGSYGYYYVNGLNNEAGKVYIQLTSAQSSNNETYYTIPLYGTIGDASGFPVDMVIINVSGTYRYLLSGGQSQKVTVVNANDSNSEVYIYANGNKVKWPGGGIADCRNIEDFMYPPPASNLLGRGWIIGAFNDNNWS